MKKHDLKYVLKPFKTYLPKQKGNKWEEISPKRCDCLLLGFQTPQPVVVWIYPKSSSRSIPDYFSRILEKGLFQLEESNVRIAEKMSGQMFEKRLQICNVIVQPCAAWWDFGLVLFWHGLLTVFMIRYIGVLIVTVTLKLTIKNFLRRAVRKLAF